MQSTLLISRTSTYEKNAGSVVDHRFLRWEWPKRDVTGETIMAR